MSHLLTNKEFADLCHTTAAIVSVNVKRGKVITHKDNRGTVRIDLSNPINQDFFKRYNEKFNSKRTVIINSNGEPAPDPTKKKYVKRSSTKKKTTSKAKAKPKPKTTYQKKETFEIPNFDDEGDPFETETSILEWAERKKKADALLQEAKAEKERLAVQKLAGQLLPVELLNSIMQLNNRSIFSTFQNDLDNFASIYCDILANGDRKKLAEITDKLAFKLEESIRRAEDVTLSSIDNAVEEYQETRNRGERK